MPGYQLTRPDGEQILVQTPNGTFTLDEYLERAERGGMTLGELLDLLVDPTTGALLVATLVNTVLTGNPTAPTQAPGNNSTRLATTEFVTAALAIVSGYLSAYALINSAALTGTPTAPNPTSGDYSQRIATTKFATDLAFSASLPLMASNTGKYVYNFDGVTAIWKDPLLNSALTGIPTAPTAAAGTSTTQLATTAFVRQNLPRGRIYYAQGG